MPGRYESGPDAGDHQQVLLRLQGLDEGQRSQNLTLSRSNAELWAGIDNCWTGPQGINETWAYAHSVGSTVTILAGSVAALRSQVSAITSAVNNLMTQLGTVTSVLQQVVTWSNAHLPPHAPIGTPPSYSGTPLPPFP